METRISGAVGQIMWAYHVAAAIRGFTVSRTRSTWKVRGTVASSDAFKITQRPLTFVAPHAKGEWSWPIVDLQVSGGQMTATLGPPQ